MRFVTEKRFSIPRPVVFCAALALVAGIYAQRILTTWADRTESKMVVLCLPRKTIAGTGLEEVIAGLKNKSLVREARIVEPSEVVSWVSAALRDTGTTIPLSPAARLGAAVELRCRGAIRNPQQFAQMLDELKSNPALERVFLDAAGQQRAATFYASAWRSVAAYLVLAWIGAMVAGIGVARTRERQASAAPPLLAASISLGKTEGSSVWKVGISACRGLVPSVAAWLCLFAILSTWPVLSPPALTLNTHLTVLGAAIALVELSCWCAALLACLWQK